MSTDDNSDGQHKPKLLDRVREAIRTRHYSRRTEKTYVGWIRRFILFHDKRYPAEMGKAEIEAFLSHLAVRGMVRASTQNQALSALLFIYRDVLNREVGWLDRVVWARRRRRYPVVLTQQEVPRVLGFLDGSKWIMAVLLYGAGLRLMECLQLRVQDVDFEAQPFATPPYRDRIKTATRLARLSRGHPKYS